jgi:hypothetical protein
MRLFGLLITCEDHEVIGDWCRDQLGLYDAVVCLDGSRTEATARIVREFGERLIYLREADYHIPFKTDHGLRRVVHQEIVRRFGTDSWVMCCHSDEFCYHDPRRIALKAEREGYDQVAWFSLHFFPHLSELTDWPRRQSRPVPERFRYFHWDYRGSGLPWREDRLYRNGPAVAWDETTHGSVRPHGLKAPAPFHPVLRHYKVVSTDLAGYEVRGPSTLYREHWADNPHRTGLPFAVRRAEDLFVAAIPHYGRCDRFDGSLPQPWNMGEEYRTAAIRPLR